MNTNPALSVYMPVYNAEGYLAQTLESILNQSLGDFEFLVVDDGSTDRSAEIVRSFRDSRIRLLSQENQGCYPARNRAIAEASGKYLANMDAEDISLPERFEKQVAFLEEHPAAVLVGTQALGCDAEDTFRLPQPLAFRYDDQNSVPLRGLWGRSQKGAGLCLRDSHDAPVVGRVYRAVRYSIMPFFRCGLCREGLHGRDCCLSAR